MTCSLILCYAEANFFHVVMEGWKFWNGGVRIFIWQIRFILFIAFFSLFCCIFTQPRDWYSVCIFITVVCYTWCL